MDELALALVCGSSAILTALRHGVSQHDQQLNKT
jgi:hypothetical protein